MHVEPGLELCETGAGVRDSGVPVRDLGAAYGVDAVAVDPILAHVVLRDVFHVLAPGGPVKIEAPVIERGAVFVVNEPFRVLFRAVELVASTVGHAVLHDVQAAVVHTLHQGAVLVAGPQPFLEFVVVARPVNSPVLHREHPDGVHAGFDDPVHVRNGLFEPAEVLHVAPDPAAGVEREKKHFSELFRRVGRRNDPKPGVALLKFLKSRFTVCGEEPEPSRTEFLRVSGLHAAHDRKDL